MILSFFGSLKPIQNSHCHKCFLFFVLWREITVFCFISGQRKERIQGDGHERPSGQGNCPPQGLFYFLTVINQKNVQ